MLALWFIITARIGSVFASFHKRHINNGGNWNSISMSVSFAFASFEFSFRLNLANYKLLLFYVLWWIQLVFPDFHGLSFSFATFFVVVFCICVEYWRKKIPNCQRQFLYSSVGAVAFNFYFEAHGSYNWPATITNKKTKTLWNNNYNSNGIPQQQKQHQQTQHETTAKWLYFFVIKMIGNWRYEI